MNSIIEGFVDLVDGNPSTMLGLLMLGFIACYAVFLWTWRRMRGVQP